MDISDNTISNNNSSTLSLLLCEKRFQNIIDKSNTSSNSSVNSDTPRDPDNIIELYSIKDEGKNSENCFNSNFNEIDYNNIKTTFNKIISKKVALKEFDSILNNFKEAFSTENKILLISCFDSLNNLSVKYEFLYVINLTDKWRKIVIKQPKINNLSVNYSIIKEIMEIMFRELSNQQNNNENPSKTAQKKYISNQQKIKSLTQDLFFNGNYSANKIEDLSNELENNDEEFAFNKRKVSRRSLSLDIFNSNKNLREIETYEYPFKDESYCCTIF